MEVGLSMEDTLDGVNQNKENLATLTFLGYYQVLNIGYSLFFNECCHFILFGSIFYCVNCW